MCVPSTCRSAYVYVCVRVCLVPVGSLMFMSVCVCVCVSVWVVPVGALCFNCIIVVNAGTLNFVLRFLIAVYVCCTHIYI